jgi:cyclomaltodextrinase
MHDGDDALTRIDEDFRSGARIARAPPTRFHVNLSERCQVRCAHCITGAPEKTANKTARDLGAHVLERLAPHLAHARYIGLTHAGEPVIAPLFDAFLDAVRDARAGAPTIVHLLTNGMAMTEARFLDVTARGVRSLSFSLDGMRAESNDLIRIGTKVETLLPRIRALAALRKERVLDVRMGISTVVTTASIDELASLVDFAADCGLDWLKLEELYATAPHLEALVPDAHQTQRAVATARAHGMKRGLTVVDHVSPMVVWKCQLMLDKRMRAASEGDDHANRVDINPCRLPWEQVCIEPDGAVRPVSFHHDIAGSLVDEDLMSLFNNAVFQRVREETVRGRLCGNGPATCARDPGPLAW